MPDLAAAVRILRSGGLVAFPTETVYGLGADATNAQAIRRIFAAKGRPATNPLIVHVFDAESARRYAARWPEAADALAAKFWPGPLTLVLPKREAIVDEATAGRESVGLRAPDHPLALELLRAFDGPLAGPSANRSNRVSPTTAEHVRKDLGGAVDLILDGGPCRVGIESTVLDLSRDPRESPVILRLGGVTREQIEAIVGRVEVFAGSLPVSISAAGPGMQEVHYAPRAAAYRYEAADRPHVEAWCLQHPEAGRAIVAFGLGEWTLVLPAIRMPSDPEAYAHRLYEVLHLLDDREATTILIEMPPDMPEWAAVRDRLSRATRAITHGNKGVSPVREA